ncbi:MULTISPECIES: 2-amino-4-hydroxy-6-hydroxymethyldihydropteridine diphosphokinase [Francisella]|uniref:2-amino-4-hydroxy-6-hydroxymethyldihydropteridine diphosphokinase n=1 Tax=Francisella opportunistica TaxID=2016517 RepID=A0A345JRB0_9GAMM|nr:MULTISPECIES: 2-amino-4-hydroxy-6-hydroxymethyldihydropteridine diphosphokinase [Francisella]APC91579.1 2-amino-4-hydroxy-6- hydroxymethyldihydropteridine pyrophosphokinase / Dihydropteroate synthase [Francisella sp. MA067296]AXH29856.1 2-amino-4-hydroxy-6-hydroxymethyldihydropteridine diphosphokinase [Francisella opportunistica]AXH31504.1 2-amino-4-hydroxy-6-hydroxymethyldihydropteridine diphosphokinase [Francisella opportunistica]AXH33151.1 2-amino-4-hydroxy-6-hydroxymethyldihydropteridine
MQYIIGIGTNIGFVLENIHLAIAALASQQNIRIIRKASLYSSKAVLKEGAPKEWDIRFLNTAVKISSSLKPEELLVVLKDIETKIGRDLDAPIWSPRVIDLDILAAEDLILETDKLTIPHKELINRNFALAPLLELSKGWHHPKYVEWDLNIRLKELGEIVKLKQTLANTMRMGIVNLSNQSFSDGVFDDDQRKLKLDELIKNGAEIIDIGAESTKPGAKPIMIGEEFDKLDKFLEYLKSQLTNLTYKPLVSIDTRKLAVMHQILAKHHDIIWMINDVECNDIEQKAQLITKYNKKYVITHNLGIAARGQYLAKDNAIDSVCEYIEQKQLVLLNQGVAKENIFFDVGFGFGKKADTANYLLENIVKIKQRLDLKALVGHSRKPSVLGLAKDSNLATLDRATRELSRKLEKLDIEIIRVHKI